MNEEAIMEQKIRQVAETVYDEKLARSQYNVSKIAFHTHNGTDSAQIFQKDIILNIKNHTQFISEDNETVRFRNVPNLTNITLTGFAANNKVAPATKRSIINGQAYFGRCYAFTGSGTTFDLASTVTGIPFIQTSNSMFSDVAVPGNRVSLAPYLAYTTDGTNDLVIAEILSYDNGYVVMQFTYALNWKLQATLTFS